VLFYNRIKKHWFSHSKPEYCPNCRGQLRRENGRAACYFCGWNIKFEVNKKKGDKNVNS